MNVCNSFLDSKCMWYQRSEVRVILLNIPQGQINGNIQWQGLMSA